MRSANLQLSLLRLFSDFLVKKRLPQALLFSTAVGYAGVRKKGCMYPSDTL